MKKLVLFACLITFVFGGFSAQALIIYTEESPPYNYTGPDGKLAGFCYEVVVEIQKRIGNNDPVLMVPWARGLNELDTKPNVLLFTTSRTGERNLKYQWIGPIEESAYGFYSKATAKFTISTLEEAKQVALIGVYRDDVRDQILTGMGFKNLDRAYNPEMLIKRLMADRDSLAALALEEAGPLAEKAGYKRSDIKLQFIFQRVQGYIAASKGTPASVVKIWNDALGGMKKDGTFKKIYKKYLPNSPLPGPAIDLF